MGVELPQSHTANEWESRNEFSDSLPGDLYSVWRMDLRVCKDDVAVKGAYTSKHSQTWRLTQSQH